MTVDAQRRAPEAAAASARDRRICIVVSRYHEVITAAMEQAAIDRFTDAGGDESNLQIISVAGSFELTAVCRAVAHHQRPDAIVAIGCIITGETTHDQHIAASVTRGLTDITVQTGVPIAFGVLTCQTLEQARARAGGSVGNKGSDVMAAAIETAETIRTLAEARTERP
jgi:6,7-dimethyl-8-ribityllumazine synthase